MTELPKILVIEDDDAIQGLVEDALTDGGFETAIARSGEEAVTLLKGRVVGYRALVTDIRLLGRFDGWEVARAARKIDPNFPVVYMCGVAAEQWKVQGVPHASEAVRACSACDGAIPPPNGHFPVGSDT